MRSLLPFKRIVYVLLWTFAGSSLHADVLIITHSYSRPDFIELQATTFKHFLKDPYEFVVFNDADNEHMCQQINAMCDRLAIKCIRVPQQIHTQPYLPRETGPYFNNHNCRHVDCVQYSMDVLGFDHPGIVFLIDSDIFLLRPLCVEMYMENKDVVAYVNKPAHNAFYFSPAFCMLNMPRLPDKKSLNFNCGKVDGNKIVDSGGYTHYYWRTHPDLTVEALTPLYSHQLYLADTHVHIPLNTSISITDKIASYKQVGFNEHEIKFLLKKPDTFEFYLAPYFIQFRGGR